ncbi:MAG: serine/threonine protein kinase [Hylemonella sp.]
MTHVDALRPGTRLAEFEIQGLLGVGGFGLVYRAYDTSLDRIVAIKEYMPAALAARVDGTTVTVRSSADLATYESGLQSFIAEARLLAKFDHPSLVKVYRFWEGNNTAYMVMPFYHGMTLSEARAQMAAPPPEAWLRTVLWSILQALHVLHRADTLHRDISPDNIFLQDIGPPVLLDLGAARRAIGDRSHRLTAVLKVNYAPIEQYAGSEGLQQGPWTDLYALAAVVYSCMRNDPPPPATARVVRDGMPSVRSVAATVRQHFGIDYSDEFVRAIQHALAVQPAERPQSLTAFVREMNLKAPPRLSKFDWRAELGTALAADDEEPHSRQFWQTQPQTVPLQRPVEPGPRQRPAWLRLAGWGALAVLLAGLSSWWLFGDRASERSEQAQPAAASAAPQALAAATAAEAAASAPGAGAAAEPAAAPPAPAPAAGPAQRPVAEKPAAPSRPAAAPAAAAATAGERAAASSRPAPARVATPAAPEAAPSAPVAPVSAPPAAPAVQPAAARELCAEANFFTRSMCIHLECQKAENAQLPVCIENRKRYPPPGTDSSP